MTDPDISQRFSRIGTITLAALYFLILVGGIVRASGSGMGCPDWPTCFGRLIPPTAESQLPPDYHEKYVGYGDTRFNAVKTWTEYLNRLVGASIGILVLVTLYRALPYRKGDRAVLHLALGLFFLVGFQAWLGSRVVASDLRPVLITAHMVTAFVIVCLLIYAVSRSRQETLRGLNVRGLPPKVPLVLGIAMAMTLLQVAMGTQIRETVDAITNAGELLERNLWREHFPIIFYIHRSFSSLILLTNLWLAYQFVRHLGPDNLLRQFAYALAGLVFAAILTGVSLDRLGFPAFVQPVHLVLANLIFGCQFFLFVALRYALAGETPIAGPAEAAAPWRSVEKS